MIDYKTFGAGLFFALAGSVAVAQTTVDVSEWGYLPNYGAASAAAADTNSPTFSNTGGDYAWGGRFQPIDISENDSSVRVTFTLTADGGISGGSFRLGLFNDNGQLQDPSGDTPAFGGVHTGFSGYLWSLAGGGHAPGSAEGGAGTGTIMGLVKADGGNWLSTQRAYSVVPEALQGPAEGSSEDGGAFNFEIELYRLSGDAVELNMVIAEEDGGNWTWTDVFRVDDIGGVPAELMSVNLIAFTDLNAGADTWEFSNVQVAGTLAAGGSGPITPTPPGGDTWLGYEVGEDGWANTADWLGHVWVGSQPWVYQQNLGYLYVAEDSHSEDGAWIYAAK